MTAELQEVIARCRDNILDVPGAPEAGSPETKAGAKENMTKNYQRDHAEIVWSEAIRTLISAKLLDSFAQAQKSRSS